jgi:hypothetical protein
VHVWALNHLFRSAKTSLVEFEGSNSRMVNNNTLIISRVIRLGMRTDGFDGRSLIYTRKRKELSTKPLRTPSFTTSQFENSHFTYKSLHYGILHNKNNRANGKNRVSGKTLKTCTVS